MSRAEEGVDVNVFTAPAGDADYHARSLVILQDEPKPSTDGKDTVLALFLSGVVSAVIGSVYPPVLLASAAFFAGTTYAFKRYLEGRNGEEDGHGEVNVHIVSGLHAKAYSRDGGEETVFGSANLTESGMFHNLEVISGVRSDIPFRRITD